MKLSIFHVALPGILFCFSSASQAGEGKVVSDYWYTVTVNKLPAEAYNEKVVLHEDKVQFMSHVWKKEEGYLNEEQLGAFSKADPDLSPLFFNFRSTYRTTETVVDGNVRDGKTLLIKVRKGGESLPTVTRSISPKTIFSVFFPIWLHKVVPTLKEGKTVSFSAVLEDDVEHGFVSEVGAIRLEKPDEYARSAGTKKLLVEFRSVRSYWYLDSQGDPIRTVMPENGAVIDRVSKEKAEAFLK